MIGNPSGAVNTKIRSRAKKIQPGTAQKKSTNIN
jgi:hypothetical protein